MKKLPIIITAIIFLLTACAYSGEGLVNAENYSGLAFVESHTPMNRPLDIPPDFENTLEVSEVSETGEFSETGETPSVPEIYESVPEITDSASETDTTAASAITTTATTATTTAAPPPPPETESPPPPVNPSFYKTLNYSEVKGVWIPYLDLSGILTKKTEDQFRKSFGEMMDNCASMGINTVYVHLRPFGDALYESERYPWSKYASGTVGTAPKFDPLKIMISEAHSRKISFQGWINPMRINSGDDISKVSKDYAVGRWYADSDKNGKYIVKCGNNWYLNPAYEEVTELIAGGAAEICAKYDVDGIHIDDYFYPVTDSSFDAAAYKASGFSSVSGFRTYNCSVMVKSLYSAVKKGNPNALFGISPQGSISNNYNEQYADVEKWCKNAGFCDYIAPQIYYGFENSAEPYKKCVSKWQDMVNYSDVKLIMGLAVYKIGKEDAYAGDGKTEWITGREIIKRQIEEARKAKSYGGVVFYSYSYLFSPSQVTPAISTEIAAVKTIL